VRRGAHFLGLALAIAASADDGAPSAAEEAFQRGTLLERVACRAFPQQTYALYLPSGYDPARRWPILYIFDPGARGARAAARFRSGAEQYGFLLAASNNSKNGPVDASLAAAQAMFEDTRARFAVDDRRLYTAGYSGGARAATLMAELLKIPVAGVVACSGGFPDERPPTRNTAFAYFATAGETDFNYAEMTALDATLEKLGVRHRLTIFPGQHSWAPEAVCAEALAWLRLQEVARKVTDDADLVGKSFDRRLAAVREAQAGGRLVEAERDLRSIERDFHSLRDTREVQTELARIDEDPAYRRAAADQARRAAEERETVSRLLRRLRTILQPDPPALPRLLSDLEIEKWKRLAVSADRDVSLSAQRVLATLSFHASVTLTQELFARDDFGRAILALSVAAAIEPENPRVWYDRACAEARAGQKKNALEDLRTAVGRGFHDRPALESDADLESLRGDAEFRSIAASIPAPLARPN
jgi:predicted esterase